MSSIKDLSIKQILIAMFSGFFLWYMGVLLVRYGGPIGLFQGHLAIITYIVLIPVTWVAIKVILAIGKIPPTHILTTVALTTCSAIGIDANALIWFQGIYGTDPTVILGGAATILWGAFVPLMIAIYMEATNKKD